MGEFDTTQIQVRQTGLSQWQERVVQEKIELNSKIKSLNDFFSTEQFGDLDLIDQNLLLEQIKYMTSYSFILDQRIQRFV